MLKSFWIASILSARSSFVLLNTRANDEIIRSSHWSHEPDSEVSQPHAPTATTKRVFLIFSIFIIKKRCGFFNPEAVITLHIPF